MESPAESPATVLVVDDDPVFSRLMTRILEREGYEVLSAATGDAAIALVRERGSGISLVLLDLIIPPRGGREVLETLLGLRPDLPLVLTSGKPPNEAERSLLEACGRRFLAKPFLPRALLREIEDALK